MTLAAGTRLGFYEILEHIGAGGMGEVYKALDTRLNRSVALKLLPEKSAEDPRAIHRFLREARAASSLNHPNIITIHEIGEAGPCRFIVMELVEGYTLREKMGQPHPLGSVGQVCRQVARALRVAHEAGIIHRDIKPENIMVREDGLVKVLDFGLARPAPRAATDSDAETAERTEPGTMVGTARYMSPEQVRGEILTTATDIFSLGLVLYEIATGRHPFTADSPIGVLNGILSQSPLPPSRLHPQIPATLENLILKMLEKDPRRRPGAEEVERVLAPLSTETTVSVAVPKRHTVGREKERAELWAGLESAESGCGLMLGVSGEPGIGKTTLVEDFLEELASSRRPCRVARGRCSERLAGTEAYLPFVEALESLVRSDAEGLATRTIKTLAPTWYVQVVSLSGEDSADTRLLSDVQAATPERRKRELGRFLDEASRLETIVLFFDDLHWADVSTVDLLSYLGMRLDSMRVLIVTTYRSEELRLAQHPFIPVKLDLQARGQCREIELGFLSSEEVNDYLAIEFPQHHFPEDFPSLVYRKTEGSPLFMVDLLRYLRNLGVITQEDASWILTKELPEIERELPESVRSMIERKLSQLGEDDRRLMVAASVQGEEFDSAVVAKVLGKDPEDVEERLAVLDRDYSFGRLLAEDETPDGTLTLRYRFVHVLYQNALYGSLTPTRRAALGKAVAEALLGFYGDQSARVASQLAYLFETARDIERAVPFFLLAAQEAARVSANHEVDTLARRGLALVEKLPSGPERDRAEFSLLLTLGTALQALIGWGLPELRETYERARELSSHAGGMPDLFPVLFVLTEFYVVRSEYSTATELAVQLLQVAESSGNPTSLMVAHWINACLPCLRGELPRGLEHQKRCDEIYHGEVLPNSALVYGYDTASAYLSNIAFIQWIAGRVDQALNSEEEAFRRAREVGHPFSLTYVFSYAIMHRQLRRDYEKVLDYCTSMSALIEEHGSAVYAAWCQVFLGWALSYTGKPESGISELRRALPVFAEFGMDMYQSHFTALLAEACVRAGRVDDGLAHITEAMSSADRRGERHYEAELHRIKGELHLLQAEEHDAERCFRQAMDIARRQQAKSFEVRAAMSLSRLWKGLGKKGEARELLAHIYGWFNEGHDTPDLIEGKVLLEELRSE